MRRLRFMVSMGIGVMPSLILLCWPSSLLIRTIRTVLHLWAWRARVRSVLQYFKTSLLSLWILSHTSQVLLTQPFHLHQHAHVSWKHPSYNERNKANPKEKTKPSNVLWLRIIHQVTDIYFSPLLLKKKILKIVISLHGLQLLPLFPSLAYYNFTLSQLQHSWKSHYISPRCLNLRELFFLSNISVIVNPFYHPFFFKYTLIIFCDTTISSFLILYWLLILSHFWPLLY